jgi:gliding motility-associated lipoprotein GldH
MFYNFKRKGNHMNGYVKSNLFKLASLMLFFIATCTNCNEIDLFERNINIPNLKWQNDFKATGQFIIKDTTTMYKVYLVLRHTDAYLYNNIWLNVDLHAQGDTSNRQKINILLGSDAQGWKGMGMNDIWEVRELIATIPLKKTTYDFSIAQIMRDNPLLHIMNVGLRVEKDSKL